jgi:hypothetical protein
MKLSTKVIEFTREDLVNLLSLITSDIHNYGLELDYDNRSEKYRTSYEYHKGVVLTRKPEERICYEDVLAELVYSENLFVLDFNDDNDDRPRYKLTYELITNGIAIGIQNGWVNADMNEWDADDGMNVLQCALFGDIIYG